ncbi:MAG: PDR/VanB family oxidoreductase [Burkholderiales bacterium]
MTEALNPDLTLSLRVSGARVLAPDIREFTFADAGGGALPAFTPGSHVLVQAPNGATRRYSLAGGPGEPWRIAVKRESGGRGGSISMVDDLNVGDVVYASPPRNEFELRENAPSYLFVAGGIGITPIRAMVMHLLATSDRPWKLYYLTRDAEATAYLDDFASPELRGKVIVHHDRGDPAQSYDLWPVLEKPKGAHLYCCGPKGLMDAVRDMTGHWSSSAVHFEDFASRKTARAGEDRPFVVRFEGEAIEVPADASILETLRARGHRIPSSCESGTCGSCRMKLVAGEGDHRDLVLSEEERADSIMVCVSRARSAEIAIER